VTSGNGHAPQRVLAVVSRFKWSHIDYLLALAQEVDLRVVWSGVGHEGAPEQAIKEGLRAESIGSIFVDGEPFVEDRLAAAIAAHDPAVVHVMYYEHERLTILARRAAGLTRRLIWECRDPLTTLRGAGPGSPEWRDEDSAIAAADGHILVSDALRGYLERCHGVDLATALIVPHAFARRNAGPLAPKLSASDGRTHIALVGTADAQPDEGRYYGNIIGRLVGLGFVVHSHFHEIDGVSLDGYRDLADELSDYHFHSTEVFRAGHDLSTVMSAYDLMGVFHELQAPKHNESATLAVCVPTKAVSAWLHGAIPIATFSHYGGLVEQIERLGVGFVVDDWADLGNLVGDWSRIAAATEACIAHRDEFTHEYQAARVAAYYEA
jgi:hypothetical protein